MLLWSFYAFAPIYICFKRENKIRKAKEIIFLTLMLLNRGWLLCIIPVAEKVDSITETCFGRAIFLVKKANKTTCFQCQSLLGN